MPEDKENPVSKLFDMIEDIAKAIKGIKGTLSSHDERLKQLEGSKKDTNASE